MRNYILLSLLVAFASSTPPGYDAKKHYGKIDTHYGNDDDKEDNGYDDMGGYEHGGHEGNALKILPLLTNGLLGYGFDDIEADPKELKNALSKFELTHLGVAKSSLEFLERKIPAKLHIPQPQLHIPQQQAQLNNPQLLQQPQLQPLLHLQQPQLQLLLQLQQPQLQPLLQLQQPQLQPLLLCIQQQPQQQLPLLNIQQQPLLLNIQQQPQQQLPLLNIQQQPQQQLPLLNIQQQ